MNRIEDYAIVGDTYTAALVARDGSIDWVCFPRFDSAACFAALLGDENNGRWQIAPASGIEQTERRYRSDTLILETDFTTKSGRVRVTDFMPPHEPLPNIIRIVEGLEGEVEMSMQLIIRFDYGWIVPWVRRMDGRLHAVGGPDALVLDSPIATHGEGFTTVANFTVRAGQRIPFVLTWYPSADAAPTHCDADSALQKTEEWWRAWVTKCTYDGPWREAVVRSLITLKALTYSPSGGIVAAVTTSLPEHIGGVRNWDYRYSWLRDATFTLYALMTNGFTEEAIAWRDWLLRAVAGDASQLQIMYGISGERRLPEMILDWLPGYENSAPVRVGNAAVEQLQLDVYGEVMDALYQAKRLGVPADPLSWSLQRELLRFLVTHWREPDEGIWEVRGERQNFTHSKVMAWVAFDRAVKTAESFGLDGEIDEWRAIRDDIHAEVCERGFDQNRFAFTQSYESKHMDAALLMIPLVGFLPPNDPRVVGTVKAIEEELLEQGLLRRYRTEKTRDGLPEGEGIFLLCTFWLVDNYELQGRHDEACALLEHLISLRNDVGLLSEQYDPAAGRMLGNFPQAFSHVGLINSTLNITLNHRGPAHKREHS
jgi:GH15 family glucan-1,4-alpha-glucosidase